MTTLATTRILSWSITGRYPQSTGGLVGGEGFYPSAKVQSVYSTAPTNRAVKKIRVSSQEKENSKKFQKFFIFESGYFLLISLVLWHINHCRLFNAKSIFIHIIIIIIMSCRQHGYPWPSLATSPYHSSPPAGLQGYILCPHIVAGCKFELVVQLLHGHMWGSIGVHHLWARSCFSSSVLRSSISNNSV